MTATTTRAITFEEFLALPETEPPSEYICGEVVPKSMPTAIHAQVVSALNILLGIYLLRTHLGTVWSDSRHARRSEQRVYLPDLAVMLHASGPLKDINWNRGAVERVPDIAIEVLSPDDRPGRVAEKVNFYLRAGVSLVWVIDPDERVLDAFTAGEPGVRYEGATPATGSPALPGFTLSMDELFATIDELITPES